jgi:outer membrane protein OmpA-like peptidoglycan-associated protein
LNGSESGHVYNAGFPLNTQYNDYALIVNKDISKGYFSSDRKGGSGGDDIYFLEIAEPDVQFSVKAPEIFPVKRRVRETFPLRNYIFFNANSTQIPDRYVLLRKDQVKDFREDQLEVFAPKELSGRAQRQMTVYYNVINILGDRMVKNPSTVILLTGSSREGSKVGKQMAETVKVYLVDVFGIEGSRISVEGTVKPKIPSEQPWGTKELALLREGDNRVSIMSESPALMMEFQTGPDAPLKPIEIVSLQEAPLDSYVTFNVEGANKAFTSWSLVVVDEKGQMQYFGPYTKEKESLPGKSILGSRPEGDYKVTMVGQTKSGKVVKKEANAHMVLWTPPNNEEMMRFSVIYEFNNSKAISIYDNYLTQVVVPKIPINAKVIIHGHTDIIGETDYNQKLSVQRANDVKAILEKGLAKANRNDVTFEVIGFGEDLTMAPFDNKYPEERFYNRTVVIDIVPAN